MNTKDNIAASIDALKEALRHYEKGNDKEESKRKFVSILKGIPEEYYVGLFFPAEDAKDAVIRDIAFDDRGTLRATISGKETIRTAILDDDGLCADIMRNISAAVEAAWIQAGKNQAQDEERTRIARELEKREERRKYGH